MRGVIASTIVLSLTAISTAAQAAPPTVVPSPGYDARLQESRSAAGSNVTAPAPVSPPVAPPAHRRKKHPH